MPEHEAPQSRNEAILQNILGEHNELLEPQSRNEAILQDILYGDSYTEDAQSRIETLLLCILNGTTTDLQPLSRNEEILIAKINGGTYDKEPQSRIEELLIEWLNAFVEKTVTGAVCSFDDAISGQPLIDLTAEIVPQQASGTPTPTNPLPISGYTSGVMSICGANLFDKTNTQDGFISGQTGEVMASTTRKCSDFIPVNPSTAYFMNGYGDLNYFAVVLFDENKVVIPNYYSGASKTAPFTFTTTATAKFARLTFIKEQLDTMSLTYGTTAPTTYEPYVGQTETRNFGTTVYGGTWKAKDGKVIVTHIRMALNSLNWVKNGSTITFYSELLSGYQEQTEDFMCSCYLPSENDGYNGQNLKCSLRASGSSIRIWIADNSFQDADAFMASLTGQTITLPLATPTEITVDPINFTAKNGVNNIYSNTGNTTVKYKARG